MEKAVKRKHAVDVLAEEATCLQNSSTDDPETDDKKAACKEKEQDARQAVKVPPTKFTNNVVNESNVLKLYRSKVKE